METLVREAESLAAEGVRELVLIAQDTTFYGLDLYKHRSLAELLRALSAVEGIEWIRILYCYPDRITDELLDTMREESKI
jgi:ribosomal protein S12 methylthiotransferase